ncbi:uncharacterized protein V1518DRAFT_414988 [Limtongia smithiae]|uniref:uncharacterized protein n=1 Tax=Limtongia smithiae TaxID=1125753 RepID=UPI0034CECEC2
MHALSRSASGSSSPPRLHPASVELPRRLSDDPLPAPNHADLHLHRSPFAKRASRILPFKGLFRSSTSPITGSAHTPAATHAASSSSQHLPPPHHTATLPSRSLSLTAESAASHLAHHNRALLPTPPSAIDYKRLSYASACKLAVMVDDIDTDAHGSIFATLTKSGPAVAKRPFALLPRAVLRYPAHCTATSMPDHVVMLSPEAVAYASDDIPGYQYVLRISERVERSRFESTASIGHDYARAGSTDAPSPGSSTSTLPFQGTAGSAASSSATMLPQMALNAAAACGTSSVPFKRASQFFHTGSTVSLVGGAGTSTISMSSNTTTNAHHHHHHHHLALLRDDRPKTILLVFSTSSEFMRWMDLTRAQIRTLRDDSNGVDIDRARSADVSRPPSSSSSASSNHHHAHHYHHHSPSPTPSHQRHLLRLPVPTALQQRDSSPATPISPAPASPAPREVRANTESSVSSRTFSSSASSDSSSSSTSSLDVSLKSFSIRHEPARRESMTLSSSHEWFHARPQRQQLQSDTPQSPMTVFPGSSGSPNDTDENLAAAASLLASAAAVDDADEATTPVPTDDSEAPLRMPFSRAGLPKLVTSDSSVSTSTISSIPSMSPTLAISPHSSFTHISATIDMPSPSVEYSSSSSSHTATIAPTSPPKTASSNKKRHAGRQPRRLRVAHGPSGPPPSGPLPPIPSTLPFATRAA